MKFGFDFDNTIANYDRLIVSVGRDLFPEFSAELKDRDTTKKFLQARPGGDLLWQKVQAEIYGRRMSEAEVFSSLIKPLFAKILSRGHSVHVVSHKTEVSPADERKIPLRKAALNWLVENGFFQISERFSMADVYFLSTREEKVAKIASIGCALFVDDLPEVFLEPGFPKVAKKILFSREKVDSGDWICCADWKEIEKIVDSYL